MTAVVDCRCEAPAVSPSPRPFPPHAVVIGAGLDGLAAAHALGHHLERVTLVERDDVPDRAAPGTMVPHSRYVHALRRVLDSPQVVMRAGLEVVGLVVVADRVRGVDVRPRRAVGAAAAAVTIDADLVVDTGHHRHRWLAALPDGLVVIGEAAGAGGGGGATRRGITAELTAAVLGRCLDEHLTVGADLTGFSAVAQRAVALVGAGAPTAARRP